MFKVTGFLFANLFLAFICFSIFTFTSDSHQKTHLHTTAVQEENHPPVVEIISPKNQNELSLNSQVRYEIRVSDKEDGESKYQEINPKEVFLTIRYVSDTIKGLITVKEKHQLDYAGITYIKTSNCMNCHAFNSKLIGPSFNEISKRYPHLEKEEDTLALHIINGSTGRWGSAKMPSNQDLKISEAKKIIEWIFKNSDDPSVQYFAGTEGAFRFSPPSGSLKYAILIASYTDHGLKNIPHQNLEGKDIIIIKRK